MNIDRSKIEKIINEIDNTYQKYSDDEFNLAMYLYIRYGLHQFNNYICDDELEEINKILKRYDSLFNEDLNDDISLILNEED